MIVYKKTNVSSNNRLPSIAVLDKSHYYDLPPASLGFLRVSRVRSTKGGGVNTHFIYR
jgi:hypothetical protein